MKNKIKPFKSFVFTAILFISCVVSAQEYNIEVKNVDATRAVIIKAETASSDIGQSMGEIYGKLFSFLGQKNVSPAGAPFAVYYKFDPQGNTEYEGGVPVKGKIETSGEISFKEYPAMKVVSVMYTGAYENMMPVYNAIDKYIKDNKLEKAGASWEVYLTDPDETTPEKNQTIIYFPVK